MKKIIMFLTIFMCFVATTAFASPSITGLQFDGTVYSGTTTVRNYDTNELIASEPINASSIKLQGAGGSYTGSDGSPNVVNVSIITDSGTYPIGTVGYNNVISVGSYQNINKIILTGTNRASSVNVFITITPHGNINANAYTNGHTDTNTNGSTRTYIKPYSNTSIETNS